MPKVKPHPVPTPIPEHTRAPDHQRDCPHTGLMYQTIVDLASRPDVRNAIEIGSTDGRGSTMAFREGIEANPNFPHVRLFCIEAVRQMFSVLEKTKASYMQCYRVCSTDPKGYYTDADIRRFFEVDWKESPWDLRGMVQREDPVWHIRERDRYNLYFMRESLLKNGVDFIRKQNKIEHFDLALVDGGTYSGRADVLAVYGAKYLVLDDIHTLKCKWPFEALLVDPMYRLIMHKPCTEAHFGYAAFERTV